MLIISICGVSVIYISDSVKTLIICNSRKLYVADKLLLQYWFMSTDYSSIFSPLQTILLYVRPNNNVNVDVKCAS